MDVALTFFLPLVGGYIFCSTWNVTRFVVVREDGHRLYFRAAFYAAFLFSVAFFVRLISFAWIDQYAKFDQFLVVSILSILKDPVKNDQADLVLISSYAFIIGIVLWAPLNAVFRGRFWVRRAIKKNEFESLLFQALTEAIPVSVTMDGGKVYVGFVSQISAPGEERDWLAILPLMSGYRREPDKKITFTTFYNELYDQFYDADEVDDLAEDTSDETDQVSTVEMLPQNPLGNLTPDDFEIVLPASKIASLNLFDAVAYAAFQRQGAKTGGDLAGEAG